VNVERAISQEPGVTALPKPYLNPPKTYLNTTSQEPGVTALQLHHNGAWWDVSALSRSRALLHTHTRARALALSLVRLQHKNNK